jgi:serine/threonine protein kinase
MEPEALLNAALQAGLLEPDKGRAAFTVYQQLQKMGAQFTFGAFLVDRGMVSSMALAALEDSGGKPVASVDTVGDFQLLELIGEGEYGAVFCALQKSLNRQVAVKILNRELAANKEAIAAFLNEARATARVVHPNVVQVFAAGSDAGLHYLAMELVDGGSARALLSQHNGKLPETLALDLGRQAAEGLKAAHAAGLLHRDRKSVV